MEPSDEALIMAYKDGDQSALEPLVRRHADGLLGYLVKMTRNHAQAEDLFQETFVRVHKKAKTFKPDGRFKPWLYSIATHLALDSFRKDKRRPSLLSLEETRDDSVRLQEQVADDGPDPSDIARQDELKQEVHAAVATLPDRQRATLVLAYFEGLPYSEVAQTLGCSVGTVKTQMSRALKTLARILPNPGNQALKGGAA